MKRYRQAIDSNNSIKLRQQALDYSSAKNYMTIQELTYRKKPTYNGSHINGAKRSPLLAPI